MRHCPLLCTITATCTHVTLLYVVLFPNEAEKAVKIAIAVKPTVRNVRMYDTRVSDGILEAQLGREEGY